MAAYTEEFGRRRLVAAQVLLTQDDFAHRRQFVNAKNTFDRLLAAGAVPVVNENDTVATEEIRFGDNDRLAALVAVMVGADLLVLLSDVEGIHERRPAQGPARLLREVRDPAGVRRPGRTGARAAWPRSSRPPRSPLRRGSAWSWRGPHRKACCSSVLAGEPIGTHLPAAPRNVSGHGRRGSRSCGTCGAG